MVLGKLFDANVESEIVKLDTSYAATNPIVRQA
jgi:hypothetical protein